MTFNEVLDQVRERVRTKGRVTYGALKREFGLDADYLADITAELIDAERVVRDEDGKVLVWVGTSPVQRSTFQVPSSQDKDPNLATSNTLPLAQDSALRNQH